MSPKLTISDLLTRNATATTSYTPRPKFPDMVASGPPTTVIVTCCDGRVNVEEVLGLQPAEAIVFRTIAGRVRPILQDIVELDAILDGALENLIVLHHTDCGGSYVDRETQREGLLKLYPDKREEIKTWEMPSWDGKGIEESIWEDVEVVRGNGFVREGLKRGTMGMVLDTCTGVVRVVE